jgi:cytoskeletal protein RodZ
MSVSESLGNIFKERRKSKGIDREEVALKTYINAGVISDIEDGVFDKLSSVYMRSFIKKYSNFLGLDTDDILKRYDGIVKDAPVESFLGGKEKKQEKAAPASGAAPARKNMQMLVAISLAVVFAALVLIFVNVVGKTFRSPPRKVAVVPASRGVSGRGEMKKLTKAPVIHKAAAEKKANKQGAEGNIVALTLTARDRVWVQVAFSGDKMFDGFLNGGDSRSWETKGTITVWTGKANMLDFTVNGRDLGTVASGVVRDIRVSGEGVSVGEKWVARF